MSENQPLSPGIKEALLSINATMEEAKAYPQGVQAQMNAVLHFTQGMLRAALAGKVSRSDVKPAFEAFAFAMAQLIENAPCPAVADDLIRLADAWADRYSEGPTREEEARRVRERCADWLSSAAE